MAILSQRTIDDDRGHVVGEAAEMRRDLSCHLPRGTSGNFQKKEGGLIDISVPVLEKGSLLEILYTISGNSLKISGRNAPLFM